MGADTERRDMSAGEFAYDDFDPNDFGADIAPVRPAAKKEPEHFPPPFSLVGADLQRPPGFVGEVTDWIDAQCRYPRRKLAVASALVTIGNIGGLRHEDDKDGVTANLLAFCVAASATGKEAVQQAMADLHVAAGVHYAVQGGIKSEQEIMRNLIEHQAAYYMIDEIGIFLQKVRNAQKRGGAAYLEGVFGSIMSGYSKANSRMLLQGDIKRELRKGFAQVLSRAQDDGDTAQISRAERMMRMLDEGLERPFLSLVGYTTPSTFDGIMDGETATQGFVGRALIVTEPDINPEGREDFRKTPMPEAMKARLVSLYTGNAFDTMAGNRVEYLGERTPIRTDPDAVEMLKEVARWLHSYADEMGENTGEASVSMIRRAYEMIAKVSFILAIPDGHRKASHVRWAFAYVRAELDAKIKLVFANDNAKDRPDEAKAARIMSYIDSKKGSSIKVLANRMKIKEAELLPVLRKMETHGMVREQMSGRKYAGKPVVVWVSTAD